MRLLRTCRFGTFWFARLLSNIGTWAQPVAEPWLLLSLGASAFLLGLDAYSVGAPVLLPTLLGGVRIPGRDQHGHRAERQCLISGSLEHLTIVSQFF